MKKNKPALRHVQLSRHSVDTISVRFKNKIYKYEYKPIDEIVEGNFVYFVFSNLNNLTKINIGHSCNIEAIQQINRRVIIVFDGLSSDEAESVKKELCSTLTNKKRRYRKSKTKVNEDLDRTHLNRLRKKGFL